MQPPPQQLPQLLVPPSLPFFVLIFFAFVLPPCTVYVCVRLSECVCVRFFFPERESFPLRSCDQEHPLALCLFFCDGRRGDLLE